MIRTGFFWSVILLAIMFGVSGYAWLELPADAQLPVHWNAQGEVDRYGGKFEGLLMMPLVGAFLVALFVFVPKIDPRKRNLEKSRTAYLAAWIGSIAVMTTIHMLTVNAALGGTAPVAKFVFVLVGLLLMIIGNYLAKTRSNWFIGLRTPWTLSSEHAWSVGNRYAGRGLLLSGLLIIFAGLFLGMTMAVALSIAGPIGSAIVATIASYLAWKNDPDARA